MQPPQRARTSSGRCSEVMVWLRGRRGKKTSKKPGKATSALPRDGWRGYRPLSWLTFETYVVGRSNREPFEAASEVARDPGKRCNPLFLYGDVGLGKTHLMNAIGNEVATKSDASVVVYIPSARFAEELLLAIEENNLTSFRKRCLEIDVLLLEDVQFLARQRAVQEEFADLFIMVTQLGLILLGRIGADEIERVMAQKLERLEKRLDVEKAKADLEQHARP